MLDWNILERYTSDILTHVDGSQVQWISEDVDIVSGIYIHRVDNFPSTSILQCNIWWKFV